MAKKKMTRKEKVLAICPEASFGWKMDEKDGKLKFFINLNRFAHDVRIVEVYENLCWHVAHKFLEPAKKQKKKKCERDQWDQDRPFIIKSGIKRGWPVSHAKKVATKLTTAIRKTKDYCVNNYRWAKKDNYHEMNEYLSDKSGGCCGSYDDEVNIDGITYCYGFNYGH